jgi:Lrp/AsnC family transcriptional regulator for asnA, asnC and gidA
MSTPQRPSARGLPIDRISRSIVDQLREDGRRSYAEIGKAVGLSEAAVRQRVQKLTDGGVIRIVALTDPQQLGLTRQAMIGVTVSGDVRVVADALAAIPAVDYVVMTAGTFDLLAEVVCEDDEELVELLNARIRALDGVVSTETFVYLKVHTQDGHGRSR